MTSSSETSISFSWSPPSITAHLTTGYRLTCSPLLEGIPTPDPLMIAPTATTATVTGLHSGVTYSCDIITLTSWASQPRTLTSITVETGQCGPNGCSVCHTHTLYTSVVMYIASVCVLVSTYIYMFLNERHYTCICSYVLTVPAGTPEMFVATAGERQVTFSWSPPPVTLRNGVITSYTLSCSPSPSSLPQSPSQPGPLTVAGFSPDTSYSCSVVASNSQGSGPTALSPPSKTVSLIDV